MATTTDWVFILGNASQEGSVRTRLNADSPEFQVFVNGDYSGDGGVGTPTTDWVFIHGRPGEQGALRLRLNSGTVEIQQWHNGAFIGTGVSGSATGDLIHIKGSASKSGAANVTCQVVSGAPSVNHYVAALGFVGGALGGGASVPDAISDLAAGTPAGTEMPLTWSAPADNGATITDYIVQYKETASGTWLTFSDGTSATTGATVTGLTVATSYDFRVAAVNSEGTGPYSSTLTQSTESFTDPTVDYNTMGTLDFDLDPRTGGSTIPVDGVDNHVNGNITDANGSGNTINYISGANGVFHGLRSVHGDLVLDFDGTTGSVMDMLTGIANMSKLVDGQLYVVAVVGYDTVSVNDVYVGAETTAGADRVWLGQYKQWVWNTAFVTPPITDIYGHIVESIIDTSSFSAKQDGVHYTGSPDANALTATLLTVNLGGLNPAGSNTPNMYIKRLLVFDGIPSTTNQNLIRASLSYEHKIPLPSDDYDVFILAGQSNMCGQSQETIEAQDQLYNPYICQLGRNGSYDMKVINAEQELDHVSGADGPGLGYKFAELYGIDNPNNKIILVPVAQGNTGFSSGDWTVTTGANYIDTVARVNAAMAYGTGTKTLKGLLWHQGEQDVSMSQAAHSAAFDAMIAGFTTDITGFTSNTKIVVGDLTPNFSASGHTNIRASIADVPNRHTNAAFAASTGLTDRGDNIHIDRASLRTFGQRYYDGWKTL